MTRPSCIESNASRHPASGERVALQADLPDELARLLPGELQTQLLNHDR